MPHALLQDAARAAESCDAAGDGATPIARNERDERNERNERGTDGSALSATARVDAVLDWLEAQRYLSDARFVESRVSARSARFGNLRIRQELKQHGVALSVDAARALERNELERALAVRERKFGHAPENAAERARQARFLVGRGFSPDVVARVLRSAAAGVEVDPGEADAVA